MADAQQGSGRVLVVAHGGEGDEGDALAGLAAAFGPALTLVPATLAQAAGEDAPVLCLWPAPEVAVARALARGAPLQEVLEGWRAMAEGLLAELRPLRRRLTLVLTGAAPPAPGALAGVLAQRLGLSPAPAPEGEGGDPPDGPPSPEAPGTLLVLVAAAGLAADPAARPLLAEIGATAVPLPQEDGPARAARALAELRGLMAEGAPADLDHQIAAMAAEIVHLEAALEAARETGRRATADAARTSTEATASQQRLSAELETIRGELARTRVERDGARAQQADRLAALEAEGVQARAARVAAEQAAAAALAQAEALRGDIVRLQQEGARHGRRDAVLGHEILRLAGALRAGTAAGTGGARIGGKGQEGAGTPDAAASAPAAPSAAPGGKRPGRRAVGAGDRKRGAEGRG